MSRHIPWKYIRIYPDIGAVVAVQCSKQWNCGHATDAAIGAYNSNPWNYDRSPGRSPSLQHFWKLRENSEVEGVRGYLYILVLLLDIGHTAINCEQCRELRSGR